VGTPGHPEDESADAVATARALGIPHRLLELSATDAPDVSELTTAYAEPFACASALGMLAVSRAVSSSAKVLLTGDGGDDVFLGYPRHRYLAHAEKVARRLPPGSGTAWASVRGWIPQAGPLRRATHFLDYATGGLGAFTSAAPGLPEFKRRGWLGERLATIPINQRLIPWSQTSARQVLSEYLEHDRRTQFVAEYMTKVDGATMHHGLEARSPFLDTVLWDHASRIPFEMRLHQGQLKAVLRELARRHIGERTARGRKRGFHIPADRWIVGRWRSSAEEAFRDSILEREGWMHSTPILSELHDHSRREEGSQRLWYAFVLESWLRHERATERAAVS
jgi:asparagine synthase (glutamine-hydrolysing)